MDIAKIIDNILTNHRSAAIGVLGGFILGAAILIFGFWPVFFVSLCMALGWLIGKRIDSNASFRSMIADLLKYWDER